MSRASVPQAHMYWLTPFVYPFAAPEYSQGFTVSIAPPLPQGGRLLANFGATSEAAAHAELAALEVPRGHTLRPAQFHRFKLEWQPESGAPAQEWEVVARSRPKLLAALMPLLENTGGGAAQALELCCIWRGGSEAVHTILKGAGTWHLTSLSCAS